MAKKKETSAHFDGNGIGRGEWPEPPPGSLGVLSSKQEVADELKISLHQFDQLIRKYPFENSGAPPKIMGRWMVSREDVYRWFRYVQRQELRHPDARRMRPEEAPDLTEIKGR